MYTEKEMLEKVGENIPVYGCRKDSREWEFFSSLTEASIAGYFSAYLLLKKSIPPVIDITPISLESISSTVTLVSDLVGSGEFLSRNLHHFMVVPGEKISLHLGFNHGYLVTGWDLEEGILLRDEVRIPEDFSSGKGMVLHEYYSYPMLVESENWNTYKGNSLPRGAEVWYKFLDGEYLFSLPGEINSKYSLFAK